MTGLKAVGKILGGAVGTVAGILFAAFCVQKSGEAAQEIYDSVKKKTSGDGDVTEEETSTEE
jgi:gas vesicle protein